MSAAVVERPALPFDAVRVTDFFNKTTLAQKVFLLCSVSVNVLQGFFLKILFLLLNVYYKEMVIMKIMDLFISNSVKMPTRP